MKWLPAAAALLFSVETGATAHSNSRYAPCFVGSHRQHNANRPVQNRVIDANSNSAFTTSSGIGITGSSPTRPAFTCSPFCSSDIVSVPRRKTSLNMGIREMFGRKKKNDNDDDEKSPKTYNGENASKEDIKLALEAIKADLEAVSEDKNKKKKKQRSEASIAKASASVARKVKNIVQQPLPPPVEPMTSASTYGESVRQRINRVKAGQMTEEEKANFLNAALTRTPPGTKGPKIRQEIPSPDGKKKSPSSASPVRKDALWNTVIGTNSPINRNDSPYKNTIRFNAKGERLDDSAKREYLDMVTNPERFSSYAAMGGYKSEKEKKESENEVVANLNLLDARSNDELADMELANRLETAAIMKEKEDAKLKAEKELKNKSEMAKLQADQKRRTEEINRREEEKVATARAAEQKKKQAEQDKIDAEKKRMADLQAAQDAYWANKLKNEKPKDDALEQGVKQVSEAEAFNAQQEVQKQAELAKINRMEKGQKKESAGESTDFVESQEKKKAKLDQFMKEQKDRLSTLSSPLPSQKTQVPKVQPRKPNNASSSPPPAAIPSLNLADLTMKKPKPASTSSTPAPTPASAPAASVDAAPRLSLAEMTMLKKPGSNGKTPVARPSPTPAARSSSGAIRQSVPVDDDDDDDDDFFAYARSGGNSGMSIKDIMAAQNAGGKGKSNSETDAAKQKSKMWGIDIDAFMD